MADFEDFLNPEPMLTPGLLGALTMLIANTVWTQFEIPQRLTGLAVSGLLGLLVVVASVPWWQRIIYWVVNSLVIFSVGVGTNAVGGALAQSRTAPAEQRVSLDWLESSLAWLDASPARAEPTPRSSPATPAEGQPPPASGEERDRRPGSEADRLRPAFFQRWF